MSSAAILTLAS